MSTDRTEEQDAELLEQIARHKKRYAEDPDKALSEDLLWLIGRRGSDQRFIMWEGE